MRNLFFLIFTTVIGMFTLSGWATPIIVNVVETGGDNEPTDTITAKWTGVTYPVTVANEPIPGAVVGQNYTVGTFGNLTPGFVDRNHRYFSDSSIAGSVPLPSYLVGGEVIMSGNDNRDNASYRLDVTVSSPALVYMLIDQRLGDSVNTDPPSFRADKMQWILDQGWTAVRTGNNRTGDANLPDEVAFDESADNTVNQYYAVYVKQFPAGTFSLFQADNAGQNMYGVVVTQAPKPQLSVGLNFAAEEYPNSPNAGSLASTAVAGAIPQANWNNLTGANGADVGNIVADAAGAVQSTTIKVTWTSPNTWASTGRGEENNGFAAGTADRALLTGYIDTGNSDGTKATVTVSGIPAEFSSGGYDVLVYCVGGVAGRGGAYTINGETKFGTSGGNTAAHAEDPGASVSDTGTYVRFRGQYGSSFTLTASADPSFGAANVNFRAPINAIQIVRNPDPNSDLVRGYVTKVRFDNIGNSVNVIDLLNNPKYINDQYDLKCLRTDFSANDQDECDNCGLVVRGYFIPTVSGPHTFYLSADDGAALFMSTDDNPANKVQIAREPTWAGRRNYIGDADGGGRGDPPVNQSAPINLNAGVRYYIEGAVKEAGGGDNLDVAVQGPGDAAVQDGARPIFGSRIATRVDQTGSTLAITQNPEALQRVPEGNTASFTVAATGQSPNCGASVLYQWQRQNPGEASFSNIPGATSPTFNINVVTPDDHLDVFRCVVRFLNIERISSSATLEVLGRECLKVVGAQALNATDILVQFSTFVKFDPAQSPSNPVEDPFNYTIAGADGSFPQPAGVRFGADGKSAILTNVPMAENTAFTVTVGGDLQSLVGSALCAAPDNTAQFQSLISSACSGVIFETYDVNNSGNIDDLENNQPNFPNKPRNRQIIAGFDSRLAVGYEGDGNENYGGRMRGFFFPPKSGNWRFHMRSDDPGRLYFNPTGPGANGKVRVGEQTGCCNGIPAGGAQLSQSFSLVKGQPYYVELLWREYGGGDYGQAAVQFEGDPAPTSANLRDALVGYGAAPVNAAGPLNIVQQPADLSVDEFTTASFSVVINEPTRPACYQWRRNGVEIPGANLATYTIDHPVTVADDNNSTFDCVISMVGAAATSTAAKLTVVPDTTKPTVENVAGTVDPLRMNVRFSELVEKAPEADPGGGSAQDEFNYQIPGNEVVEAKLGADGRTVSLKLRDPLAPDTVYPVTIGGVYDLAGNEMAPVTINVRSLALRRGYAAAQLYLNISGGMAEFMGSPKYPGFPDLVRYKGDGELNTFDEFENYGARMSGWLKAPVSGAYHFYMSSDDAGALFLSTDASPANLRQIAAEPVWNGRRDWLGTARRNAAAPENRSATLFPAGIELVAGEMYYFEALVKEGGGGDNLAYTWQLPGEGQPASGSAALSGVYTYSLVDPTGATIEITQQPVDQVNVQTLGAAAPSTTFTVAVAAGGPNAANVSYQWMRNNGSGWNVVKGARSASYTLTPALADNGAKFRCEVFVPGAEVISSEATLRVVQVNTPPRFTAGSNQAVNEDAGPQTVANWATGISHYTAPGGLQPARFDSLPVGSELGGNAAVTGGILHLTDAINSQQSSFVTPASPVPVDSLVVTFKARIGGGTCCGDRTADGWSVTIGDVTVPVSFPVAAEEGAAVGNGFAVNFDSWDNGGLADDDAHTAPNVDVKVAGNVVAYQAFDGVREGGRAPSGPFINDPATGQPMSYKTGNAFTDVRIQLDSDGTLDVEFKGVKVVDNVQTGLTLPLSNARVAFGARTGGANDNHWIDDLLIVGSAGGTPVVVYPPQSVGIPEQGQTVQFLVENDNPSLFSAQPAVSPTGTLTYTPAPNAFGVAQVTVRAQDNGGTEYGGDDTSDPQVFTITVAPVNDCPVAAAQAVATDEGVAVPIQLSGSDVEGDALTYAISQGPAHGSLVIDPNTGAGTYTPAAGYSGPDSFKFTVNDGTCAGEATVTITVRQVNRCPVAVAKVEPNVQLWPGQTETVAIAGCNTNACLKLDGTGSSDPDGNTLTYTWVVVHSDGSTVPLASGATATACLEVGTYRIRLIVDDGRCDNSADVEVEIVTASEAVDVLIDKVNNSNYSRNKRPLIASLKAAGASFERGSFTSAVGQLGAFVNKCRAQIAKEDPALAADLIRLANAIIASVDCIEQE